MSGASTDVMTGSVAAFSGARAESSSKTTRRLRSRLAIDSPIGWPGTRQLESPIWATEPPWPATPAQAADVPPPPETPAVASWARTPTLSSPWLFSTSTGGLVSPVTDSESPSCVAVTVPEPWALPATAMVSAEALDWATVVAAIAGPVVTRTSADAPSDAAARATWRCIGSVPSQETPGLQ